MRVDFEEMRAMRQRRGEINAVPIEEIEWYENGERVVVDPEALHLYRQSGLASADFAYYMIDNPRTSVLVASDKGE